MLKARLYEHEMQKKEEENQKELTSKTSIIFQLIRQGQGLKDSLFFLQCHNQNSMQPSGY